VLLTCHSWYRVRRACRQQNGQWVNGGRAVSALPITAIKTTSETDQGLAARNIGILYHYQGRLDSRLVRREWSKRRYKCTTTTKGMTSTRTAACVLWRAVVCVYDGFYFFTFEFRVFASIRRRRYTSGQS